jgi:hypothetical protein
LSAATAIAGIMAPANAKASSAGAAAADALTIRIFH